MDEVVSRDAYLHLQHELEGALRDGKEAEARADRYKAALEEIRRVNDDCCRCTEVWSLSKKALEQHPTTEGKPAVDPLAAEREACAQVAEDHATAPRCDSRCLDYKCGLQVAEAIRNRGTTEERKHDFRWDPCNPGAGGLLVCKVCDLSYCVPPWTKESAMNDECPKATAG